MMQAEGMVLSEDLSHLEQSVRQKVLEIGAKAVELHLASRPLGYEGSSRACDNPQCGHDQKFVGHRPRTLATLLGAGDLPAGLLPLQALRGLVLPVRPGGRAGRRA